jgi:hypothetical protein
LELVLPERWYKILLSVWDKCIDDLLAKIFSKRQTEKCQDAVQYYDNYRRTWSTINFETQFESWPRSDLIKQIKMYEIEKQARFQRLHPKKKPSWNSFMVNFHGSENKVLAQAFDEAFK